MYVLYVIWCILWCYMIFLASNLRHGWYVKMSVDLNKILSESRPGRQSEELRRWVEGGPSCYTPTTVPRVAMILAMILSLALMQRHQRWQRTTLSRHRLTSTPSRCRQQTVTQCHMSPPTLRRRDLSSRENDRNQRKQVTSRVPQLATRLNNCCHRFWMIPLFRHVCNDWCDLNFSVFE